VEEEAVKRRKKEWRIRRRNRLTLILLMWRIG
jgi:hypothetical protein